VRRYATAPGVRCVGDGPTARAVVAAAEGARCCRSCLRAWSAEDGHGLDSRWLEACRRVQVLVHHPLCRDAIPAADAIDQGAVDAGRLYPQLRDALPLRLQECEVSEERDDLVAARGRGELEDETSLIAAPLVKANRPLAVTVAVQST
jgi:hypothetical protein